VLNNWLLASGSEESVTKEAGRDSPALCASILHLRPNVRPPLLSGLAELGIFVCEHRDANDVRRAHADRPIDILVVLGDDNGAHADIASALGAELEAAVVAVLPTGASTSLYTRASAATTHDDELRAYFRDVFLPAASQARNSHKGAWRLLPAECEARANTNRVGPTVDPGHDRRSGGIRGRVSIGRFARSTETHRERPSIGRRMRWTSIGALSTWNLALWGLFGLTLVGR
jgi:hypothetical protein